MVQMQYNSLKRVPIRVTHEQLQSHQLAYARTLAEKHISSENSDKLRPYEVDILEDLCRPLLCKASELQESNTAGDVEWPHPLWDEPKELLIPLGGLDVDNKLGDAAASLYHLLSLRQIQSLDPSELLGLYPYFIWQVPEKLYKHSLQRWKDEHQASTAIEVLTELERCLQDEACPPQSWMGKLKREDKGEMASVYSILRLVATGVHDLPSPPASTLFLAISRADWLKRTRSVLRLVQGTE
jgi:DNA-binding Xre family transcriptional regulator